MVIIQLRNVLLYAANETIKAHTHTHRTPYSKQYQKHSIKSQTDRDRDRDIECVYVEQNCHNKFNLTLW